MFPACRRSSDNRYPFVAAAALDASPADLQRVFGANGQLDAFTRDQLSPLLDTGQRMWRWRDSDPVAAGFANASAAQFQKAAALRDLVAGGLALNVGLDALGEGVTAVELSAGGTTYRLDAANRSPRPLLWNLAVLPLARLAIFSGNRELRHIEAHGPFALFRLMDNAVIENAGPSRIRARFGAGPQRVSLAIDLPSDTNPFGRGGPFAFRCPTRL
jgi:type VI secretion system protein ImpL